MMRRPKPLPPPPPPSSLPSPVLVQEEESALLDDLSPPEEPQEGAAGDDGLSEEAPVCLPNLVDNTHGLSTLLESLLFLGLVSGQSPLQDCLPAGRLRLQLTRETMMSS